jgi:uncharacterized membrane protein (UPF0127 family)
MGGTVSGEGDRRSEIGLNDAYMGMDDVGRDPLPIRFRDCEWRRFLGLEIPVATTWLSRLLGLALLTRQRAGDGLLIPGCRSVHTIGMRFRLDLLFLDRQGLVVEICRDVPAGRFFRCRRAAAVLELPSP